VIVGDGLPIIAHMPGAKGVDNMRLRGGTISVRFGPSTGSGCDEVELSGKGLEGLSMPSGFKADEKDPIPLWRGKLAVGKQIALEEL